MNERRTVVVALSNRVAVESYHVNTSLNVHRCRIEVSSTSNRSRIVDVNNAFVIYCNYVPLLYSFRDIAILGNRSYT